MQRHVRPPGPGQIDAGGISRSTPGCARARRETHREIRLAVAIVVGRDRRVACRCQASPAFVVFPSRLESRAIHVDVCG